jgi:hypothetical protein
MSRPRSQHQPSNDSDGMKNESLRPDFLDKVILDLLRIPV